MDLSPQARFNPTVTRHEWHPDGCRTMAELAREAGDRFAVSAGSWQRALWHGGLHVNRRRVDIDAPPDSVPAGQRVVLYVFNREPEPVPVSDDHVLMATREVVAIDKPAWLPVQGTRASTRFCLEAQVRDLVAAEWITPAHRLDRQTSGVILFALSRDVARSLHRQFEARSVGKTYLAWVEPPPATDVWKVEGYMVRAPHPQHAYLRLSEKPCPGGRASSTRFEQIRARGGCALVRARPHTGRTHQIRVHLAYGGTPIIGDRLYGDEVARAERLLLHSESLEIVLPHGRETLRADPPRDFESLDPADALASHVDAC